MSVPVPISARQVRRRLPKFQTGAKQALANSQLRRNLYKATHTIRDKRAIVVGEMADWQELREAGRALKERVLRHLDTYLLELEASVQRAGGKVHWARDANEANAIIAQIVESHNVHEVIKVKSLTTDEIKLNEALAARGIAAIETDLAELIIQLAGEPSALPGPLGGWTTLRDLPSVPKQSFREWWRSRQAPGQTSSQTREETSS